MLILSSEKIQLYQEDMTSGLHCVEDHTVDCIITDPPYAKQYEPLYQSLLHLASQKLYLGGFLLVIVPHHMVQSVLKMNMYNMRYRWIISMWQNSGPHARMAMGIEVCWKPILWFVHGPMPTGWGFVRDGFVNDPPTNKQHKWQQSASWAEFLIKNFTNADDVILDPFVGTGTTLIEAHRLGRLAIGVDNDPAMIKLAQYNISQLLPHDNDSRQEQ